MLYNISFLQADVLPRTFFQPHRDLLLRARQVRGVSTTQAALADSKTPDDVVEGVKKRAVDSHNDPTDRPTPENAGAPPLLGLR